MTVYYALVTMESTMSEQWQYYLPSPSDGCGCNRKVFPILGRIQVQSPRQPQSSDTPAQKWLDRAVSRVV
jgi:hypothetical protein